MRIEFVSGLMMVESVCMGRKLLSFVCADLIHLYHISSCWPWDLRGLVLTSKFSPPTAFVCSIYKTVPFCIITPEA